MISQHYSLDPGCDYDTINMAIRDAGRTRRAQALHLHKKTERCPGLGKPDAVVGCRVIEPIAWPPGQLPLGIK